jgi:hypothetical protein
VLLPGGFRLVDQANDFRAALRVLAAELEVPIGLVIFDTLFAHAPGHDVLAQKEMTRVTGAMRGISDEFGCFVLGVHHKPAGADKMFGSVALGADADAVLEVTAPSRSQSVLHAEKLRGDPGVWKVRFEAKVCSLGRDEDGDEVTAPYVVAGSQSAEEDFADLQQPRNDAERVFLSLLPVDGRWASEEEHRRAFVEAWLKERSDIQEASARKTRQRTLEALSSRGLVAADGTGDQGERPARLRLVGIQEN